MATSTRPPEDQSVIEINDPAVFRWWCGRLGCSDLRLIAAVREAGPDARRVRHYLRMEKLFGRAPSSAELQDEIALFSETAAPSEATVPQAEIRASAP